MYVTPVLEAPARIAVKSITKLDMCVQREPIMSSRDEQAAVAITHAIDTTNRGPQVISARQHTRETRHTQKPTPAWQVDSDTSDNFAKARVHVKA